jgi:chromosome segregation ATPase
VEDLQAQLRKEHDDHEGVVGELQMKISEQEKELKLAMEVAVRHTETEWKLKVDELQVALATQEGELEKLQAQYEQQSEHVEQLETHIMDIQIQLEAIEEARAKKGEQLDEQAFE